MPDVTFHGPDGRLEGRYNEQDEAGAPIALILHPHPEHGGTMNNKVVYTLFHAFVDRGFSVLRFNFRGVGRSQGEFDHGVGELSDAAAALDWLQSLNEGARQCWIGGFSFGAWIGMQLLMRRPEITGFLSLSPPANLYDFSFLAPCPSAGLILHGEADEHVPEEDVNKLAQKLVAQRGLGIDYRTIKDVDHFYTNKLDVMGAVVNDYLDTALVTAEGKA
jgi:alpha/beta superfamily hydrolase